jgi:uncharacterized protein YcfL
MNRLLAALAAALLAGCATSSDVATQIVASDEPPGFLVVATNPRFADAARPTELKRGVAEDGQSLKITLLLANATNAAERLNYRVEWLDKDGAPIQGALPVARAATVPALGYTSITAVATHPKAAGFRISLTEPFAAATR